MGLWGAGGFRNEPCTHVCEGWMETMGRFEAAGFETGRRSTSKRGEWKPRASGMGLVSEIGFVRTSARDGRKPWDVLGPVVSGTAHRSTSGQGKWKPRASGMGLVPAMGLVRTSVKGRWKPSTVLWPMVSETSHRSHLSGVCGNHIDSFYRTYLRISDSGRRTTEAT